MKLGAEVEEMVKTFPRVQICQSHGKREARKTLLKSLFTEMVTGGQYNSHCKSLLHMSRLLFKIIRAELMGMKKTGTYWKYMITLKKILSKVSVRRRKPMKAVSIYR